MSGGSYNYLFAGAGNIADLGENADQLQAMADRLQELMPDSFAACETLEVIAILRAGEAASLKLREVWRAVEWYDSGDWSKDQAMEEIQNYEREQSEWLR